MKVVKKNKVLNIIQEEIDIILGIRTDVEHVYVKRHYTTHLEESLTNNSDLDDVRRIKLQVLNKLRNRILEET